jgi:hypothetical protein
VEHFPCDEALETANDLGFAAAFSQSPGCIGLGLFVPAQAYESNTVESGIGLSVAPAIEAMSVGLARTGRKWADTTERGKRRIGSQTFGLIANRHQQGGSTIGSNAVGLAVSAASEKVTSALHH